MGAGDGDAGPRLILVGPGRLGLSLAADLTAAGLLEAPVVVGLRPDPPSFLTRQVPAARYLAAAPGAEAAGAPPGEAGEGDGRAGAPSAEALARVLGGRPADALFFAVPDDALAPAAGAWAAAYARSDVPTPGVVLHTSGFHGSEALAPLAEAGASAGSWHPLTAIAAPRRGAFRERTVGIEGRGAAIALAETLAEAVGARAVRVRPGEKARWHAAAVFASNCLVACLSVAAREAAAASDGAGLRDLLPLARSALEEVAERELPEGLTGPVARGDAGTVAGHLLALDPAAAALYRLLAEELLLVAGPRLDEERRRALRAALAPSPVPEEADAVERG